MAENEWNMIRLPTENELQLYYINLEKRKATTNLKIMNFYNKVNQRILTTTTTTT